MWEDIITALELDLDLLPLWFETEDFSLTCFFAAPVTTSNIVGSSLIMLKSRFLHYIFKSRENETREEKK